jgi:hypothetical protein
MIAHRSLRRHTRTHGANLADRQFPDSLTTVIDRLTPSLKIEIGIMWRRRDARDVLGEDRANLGRARTLP